MLEVKKRNLSFNYLQSKLNQIIAKYVLINCGSIFDKLVFKNKYAKYMYVITIIYIY